MTPSAVSQTTPRPSKTHAKKEGLYMYSVIAANRVQSFGPIGLSDTEEGAEVVTIPYQDIACVVSSSPVKEWDISRENMMTHQKVNEAVMENHVVLPVKFCTIAEAEKKIVDRLLKSRYEELTERLRYFGDKAEYGVKALWASMDTTYTDLMDENPRLKEWRDRLASQPFDKARNDMIILGQQVKDALERKRKALEVALYEALRPHAVEAKTNKTVGDRMVLNGAFLISRQNQSVFDTSVSQLSAEYKKGLQFKYVGPTPPANFIEIVVNWGTRKDAEDVRSQKLDGR